MYLVSGAAAASALTMPKSGQVASAVLRPSHPASMHIPVTVSATAIQSRTVMPVRPGTPPVTTIKATTPTVTQLEPR